ncbi:hypothetical protein [Mucilaginibacter boryungensis]|uniref:hypothetical protein n=1 Tax=Mucilaginibacter boryungensis TaxID=768480 RepID=UPI00362DE69C
MPQESATIGVIGGNIALTNSFAPELDITYFFAKNFWAELILGTVKHKAKTTGSNLTAIGGPAAADVDLEPAISCADRFGLQTLPGRRCQLYDLLQRG